MKSIYFKLKQYFKHTDCILWLLVLCATLYSFLLIASLQRNSSSHFLLTQSIAVIAGIAISIIVSNIDYKWFLKFWWIFAFAGLTLSALVFLFGIQVTGTDDTAWIALPGGITIQPSEFVKICFIITFSKHIEYLKKHNQIRSFKGVLSLGLHALIPVGIIHLQGDDGTVLIFLIIAIAMAFIAGVPAKYFLCAGAVIAVSIPVLWSYFLNNDQRNRFMALFDLDGNALTNFGWQQYQGKVSIASGQMSGKGLFNGTRVSYGIVPEQQNDFIFTVAGEELGFIGCLIILILLLAIILRVFINAKSANDFAGSNVCYGVFAMIASQTIINLSMVLGFMPVVGITLPFFSSGGSSVLSMYICIGLVQSVVMHNQNSIEKIRLRIGRKDRIKI